MDVKEINKRNLGKMIVHYIGHEGVDEKRDLRHLLQACIDFLQTEDEGVWRNASITILDNVDGNMYTIASGTRKHQFMCSMKNGKPCINHTPSTGTTHDPFQKEKYSECPIS